MPVGTGSNTVPLGVRMSVPVSSFAMQPQQAPQPTTQAAPTTEASNGGTMGPALPPDLANNKDESRGGSSVSKSRDRDRRSRSRDRSSRRRSRSRDRRRRSRSRGGRRSRSRDRRSGRRSRSRSPRRRRRGSRSKSRSRDRGGEPRKRSDDDLQEDINRLPPAQRDGLLAAARAGLLNVTATLNHLAALKVPNDLIKRLQDKEKVEQLSASQAAAPGIYTGPAYSHSIPNVGSAAPVPMANSRMPQPPGPPPGWMPPQEPTLLEPSATGDGGKKRKSRWGKAAERAFVPGMPTVLPSGISEDQQKQYLLQLQIEELTRKLRAGELDIAPFAEDRSPSPEPIYDNRGIRLNTREVRKKQKMEQERHRLINDMVTINPGYKPPMDYRAPTIKLNDRVWIDRKSVV